MYGSQGIQPEGRAVEVGAQISGQQGQHRKGKGKTLEQKERDKRRKAEIRELKKAGQYTASKKPAPSWFQCSCCMAKAGIGSHRASRLIGIHNTAISRQWKNNGIKPKLSSWVGWTRPRTKEEDETHVVLYKRAAMSEIRQHRNKSIFPCWSVLLNATANPEYARRKSLEFYHALSTEKKKERNDRITANRDKVKHRAALDRWKHRNPEKYKDSIKTANRKRKLSDPGYRAQCNLRKRFRDIMSVVINPEKKWNSSLIGCDTRQLAAHLEAQFKRGMSWENYGTHWHVDHVVPVSHFDHTVPHHVKQCWHYTNLQPLEAALNMAKSNKILKDSQLSLTI